MNYSYDADGRRVRKNYNNGGIVDYVYDLGGHTTTMFGAGGSWSRGEIYAGGRHLGTYDNNTTYFSFADWLGSERARSTSTGAPYETCTNNPFGDGLTCAGGTDYSPMHFTGKEFDPESGLHYFGARYYTSQYGRFMVPDWEAKAITVPYADFGDPQSLNLYSYVRNNPLNKEDEDGHDPISFALTLTPELVECPICEAVLWGGAAAVVGYEAYQIHKSRQAPPGSRPGQDFTRAGKRTIDQANAAKNNGENKCNRCGKKVRKVKNEKGKPTPDDQLQRHHMQPKAGDPPGSGTPENGEVLCPECHQAEHSGDAGSQSGSSGAPSGDAPSQSSGQQSPQQSAPPPPPPPPPPPAVDSGTQHTDVTDP